MGLSKYELRKDLYPGEDKYFQENKNVTGMAAEDNKVILNPYSSLSDTEKKSVVKNEQLRLWMRNNDVVPNIILTKEQELFFKGTAYENAPNEKKQTIIARILSGDPSAKATKEQKIQAQQLLKKANKRESKRPLLQNSNMESN
jgi:hypothetical protein